MTVLSSTCPSAETLQAYSADKLDTILAEAVNYHLENCPRCRDTHRQNATPAPNTMSDSSSAPQTVSPSAVVSSQSTLPPELAALTQYEIRGELGRGGMGVVYLARNKLMDRLEVLKVVNKALLDRPEAVDRFLREIRAAARLNHPNVVRAYSAVQSGELLAFAMEYVEGEDLAKVVKTRGPLPIPEACECARQAAAGLQHALDNGMVHRDVKPQNLIRTHQGGAYVVKVLDFGLAKASREKGDDAALTATGQMLGTPHYIAPEQARDAAKADIRADIYSLGCTLYCLLTGSPPFQGDSTYAVLLAHHSTEMTPVNLVRPEVPEELAAVVRKMMAKNPADRYQTPAEAAEALLPFVKPGAKTVPARAAEPRRAPIPPAIHFGAVQAERPAFAGREGGCYNPTSSPPPSSSSGKATASMVLGLLALLPFGNVLTGIPAILCGLRGMKDIRESRSGLRGKGRAVAGIVTGSLSILYVPAILFGLFKIGEATTYSDSERHLQDIGLAMHKYYEANSHFPGPSTRQTTPGKPLPGKSPGLSWRVAILPYLGEEELYKQFRFDEPWDSPHNRPLLARMPRVFETPGGPPRVPPGHTFYQGIVGPGAFFDPQKPSGIRKPDIADASSTFMVVEADRPVPWTKPDDLTYLPDGPLPQFGKYRYGSFLALFADGDVHWIPPRTPNAILYSVVTRTDGQTVNIP
jgi:serine/threonine protein kinase